jgi:hypothetical protein
MRNSARKICSWTLLACYFALNAGGSALHFSPLFGLHHGTKRAASGDHHAAEQHCSHGCHATATKSPSSPTAPAGEWVNSDDDCCAEHCALCSYYSQGKLAELSAPRFAELHTVLERRIARSHFSPAALRAGHFARGPPLTT